MNQIGLPLVEVRPANVGAHFDVTRLPANLSRPARGVLAFACLVCDPVTGEVSSDTAGESAADYIGRIYGHDDARSARRYLAELAAAGLVRIVQHYGATRVFVMVLVSKAGGCEVCGEERATLRGARRCPGCVQLQRREWKADALEIWRRGKRKGWSDMKVAWHVSHRLGRPLWGRSEDGEQGSGSGAGEGVIPAMVKLGVFPASMLELVRRARNGAESDDL